MITTSDNKLWVGTWNLQPLVDLVPLDSTGGEIWCYDGVKWNVIVGEKQSAEINGGFGSTLNIGVRSLIEYPENSETIWAGTWNMDVHKLKTFNGCELWRRI